MPCSRAIFLIQRSALIEGISSALSEKHHHQGEEQAHENRRRQGKVEAEVAPADRKVARELSQRKTERHQQTRASDDQTREDQESPHHSPRSVSYTHLRAHETPEHLVCRLLLEKKK